MSNINLVVKQLQLVVDIKLHTTNNNIIVIGQDKLSEHQYNTSINKLIKKYGGWKVKFQYKALVQPITYICFIVVDQNNQSLGYCRMIHHLLSDEFPLVGAIQFFDNIVDIKRDLNKLPGELLDYVKLKSSDFI